MPFAVDRREKMWTASNLNSLYSRFDQKCARVLSGKSPLFANSKDGVWRGQYPYGVWYVYRLDPDTCKRLRADNAVGPDYIPGIGTDWRDNHSQVKAGIELSKLENKHLDVEGGQVYVDHYVTAGDPFTCDVASIHYSFEIPQREIAGVSYDVHLGWDPTNAGLSSYVRGSLGAGIDPTLPPGRMHKHRLAVAEIALEGIYEFRILRSYQRYDCWRVHNCGTRTAVVYLQLPDGSADRQYVAPGGCRAFRRRPDGTWAVTFPGGTFCRYFFPFFTGDVPFFAGGPPQWSVNSTESEFLALERSAQANNVANPFILMEWRRVMGALHDPFAPYDIRQIYSGVYDDPYDANTTIGDAVFTWGRARVEWLNNAGFLIRSEMKVFSGMTGLPQQLRALGMDVVINTTNLTLTSYTGVIRIYPVDANIFTTGSTPYWEIGGSPVTISTIYPASYVRSDQTNLLAAGTWQAGNEPTIFDTMRNLRRKVAVEEGFLNVYTDAVDIIEDKVSTVTMTPLGLMLRATSATGISGNLLVNFEATADNESLWVFSRPPNWGSGPWFNTRYTATTRTYYLQAQRSSLYAQWSKAVPAMSMAVSGAIWSQQAVHTAFIPPGGPWGFSSSIYDDEKARAYDFTPASEDSRGWGADYWQNKWGGPGAVDAFVRIPGSPNKTSQYTQVTDPFNLEQLGAMLTTNKDDIFKDQDKAAMASSVPLAPPAVAASHNYAEGVTDLSWTNGWDTEVFNLAYYPVGNPELPGGGPFFHKIPKSTWLWNLLEWSVRGWTRAVPLCLGQDVCPIYDASGTARVLGVLTVGMLLLGTSGRESGQTIPSYYVSEEAYDILIANGIVAYKDTDPGGNDYWYVPSINLATYCDTQGFTAWRWDTENGSPNETTPVAATAYDPLRNYGDGERRQAASYEDVTTGDYVYLTIRYVDLRLPNELAS